MIETFTLQLIWPSLLVLYFHTLQTKGNNSTFVQLTTPNGQYLVLYISDLVIQGKQLHLSTLYSNDGQYIQFKSMYDKYGHTI